ncbi:MAG: hypothetical protein ACYTG0_31950 [Planctomycetota bacterium]|jgi:hypothetical protein
MMEDKHTAGAKGDKDKRRKSWEDLKEELKPTKEEYGWSIWTIVSLAAQIESDPAKKRELKPLWSLDTFAFVRAMADRLQSAVEEAAGDRTKLRARIGYFAGICAKYLDFAFAKGGPGGNGEELEEERSQRRKSWEDLWQELGPGITEYDQSVRTIINRAAEMEYDPKLSSGFESYGSAGAAEFARNTSDWLRSHVQKCPGDRLALCACFTHVAAACARFARLLSAEEEDRGGGNEVE